MPEFLLVILVVLGALLALCVLAVPIYLFVLVRPRGKPPTDKALLCDYAHRGLHGHGVPENSLAAFARACEAGHGIELDVQLSADGEVMVFHDYTLMRMTGYDQKLCALTAAELSAQKLDGSNEKIPTFAEVLTAVDGRVPLLVELKGESFDVSLCIKVAALLREYPGLYCIESFNPLLLREMKKHLPHAYCGLLYTNVVRDKKKFTVVNMLLTLMTFNFLCKPNFIAYNQSDRHSLPVRLATRLWRAPRFVWTVRSASSMQSAHKHSEHAIFENRN